MTIRREGKTRLPTESLSRLFTFNLARVFLRKIYKSLRYLPAYPLMDRFLSRRFFHISRSRLGTTAGESRFWRVEISGNIPEKFLAETLRGHMCVRNARHSQLFTAAPRDRAIGAFYSRRVHSRLSISRFSPRTFRPRLRVEVVADKSRH